MNKEKKDDIEILNNLQEPIKNKYVKDNSELVKHLKDELILNLTPLLPKVVFWENNKNYILQPQTKFSEILNKESLNDISRPLVNVFRIGLKIKTIDELESIIKEIQNNHNERSKLEAKIRKEINKYIKAIWADYEQELKITLEEERIRVEVFNPDPKYENASYYDMTERSQGCQTFIQFLLTIGTEAEHGEIKKNIDILKQTGKTKSIKNNENTTDELKK